MLLSDELKAGNQSYLGSVMVQENSSRYYVLALKTLLRPGEDSIS